MSRLEEIKEYWDRDAATYDRAPQHKPQAPLALAAWTAALQSLLPPAPARVLDCGAGTGFLSLIAARLGHHVTALDISTAMLAELRRSATAEGLEVHVVEGSADRPDGHYDAVMERHLLWTMEDPASALAAWRAVAPDGRLVLVEILWEDADPVQQARARLRRRLHELRRLPPEHHGEYSASLRTALPLGAGSAPSRLVPLVAEAGWPNPRVTRLRDVEWAEAVGRPVLDRLLGAPPRAAIVAGS